MAKQNVSTVLVSPDGDREWTPESAEQATNLRARGWAPKPASDAAGDSTTDAGTASGLKTTK